MNYDIRFSWVTRHSLFTKQKQLVYKIGRPSFLNCCSDTTAILVLMGKYTGTGQSFIVCAVRNSLVQ